jgi:flavin-dependent dehydrogenase
MPELDVIIIGAGPAGLSAATRLHALGHRVAVIAPQATRNHRQLETVPRMEVVTQAFPGLDLTAPTLIAAKRGGVSWWTGDETATRNVSVIDRGSASETGLDEQLLYHAARAGVCIHAIERGAARMRFDEMWHVSTPSLTLRSRFLIDASGRHSSLRQRTPLTAWRQVVITGELQLKPDAPALWTESLPDGWLWAVRDRTNHCLVSLFVDPSCLTTDRGQLWQRVLTESRLAAEIASSLSTTLHLQEATPAAADDVYTRNLLHLGDAALARCPLASQGLSAAISDGQSAAIALHSFMAGSATEPIVSEFLNSRHHQAVRRHVKFLDESYAATSFDTPYWQSRGAARSFNSHSAPMLTDLDQPVVLATQWQVRPHPTLEGDCIRVAPCLCSAEETLRWIAGCPAAELLAPLCRSTSTTLRALLLNWDACQLADGLRARQVLDWLIQRRVLVPA